MNYNSVDFFRFSGGYCDVFKEGDGYLYAVAEYGNYNGFLECNEYRRIETPRGVEYIRYDGTCADSLYLEQLTPAPVSVARDIIAIETRRTARYCIDDEQERENYLDYALCDLEHDCKALGGAHD